jgi:DNA polymerase-3 subunit gamma/tau
VLVNAIKSSRLAHSFLFSGPRGVGKTSTARILAKALNCEQGPTSTPCNECSICEEIASGNSLSIIEIDGASNNSVEDIRTLREKVGMIPVSGRFKIYIIDEVHMLSKGAFNALLKTLEEPPVHVKFIFATTEIHKIPATILSRCQRFDFKRIPPNLIVESIQQILNQEGISAGPKVLSLVAKAADGSMRDALSILDQIISSGGTQIGEDEVETLLGLAGREKLQAMAQAITLEDAASCINQLQAVLSMGGTLEIYWQQLMEYFRDGLMLRIARKGVDLTEEEAASVEEVFKPLSNEDLIRILKNLAEGFDSLRASQRPRVMAEMILLRVCDRRPFVGLEDILIRLKELEKNLRNSGGPPIPSLQPTRAEKVVFQDTTPSPTEQKTSPDSRISPSEKPAEANLEESENNQKIYETLIRRVEPIKKSLAALLAHGRIIDLNKKKIVLGFEKGFEKMINFPGNIQILNSELGNILDRPVQVEFLRGTFSSDRSRAAQDRKSTLNKNDVETLENNPVFKKVVEMFDAKVIRIQKITS